MSDERTYLTSTTVGADWLRTRLDLIEDGVTVTMTKALDELELDHLEEAVRLMGAAVTQSLRDHRDLFQEMFTQ